MQIVSTDRIEKVIAILKQQGAPDFSWDKPIKNSIDFLNSTQSKQKTKTDPYWPKWNNSWWHILSLIEIKQSNLIPCDAIVGLHASIQANIVPFFPLLESELSPQIDPYRNIICHCALGTYIQMCFITDNLELIPDWIENWYLNYQIDDGGFNCDDEAYHKTPPKSSLVSTLPMLEALLLIIKSDLKLQDKSRLEKLLDHGAQYFLKRNLIGSSQNKDKPIRQEWLDLSFPRFYELDALRVLKFVNQWAKYKAISLDSSSIYLVLDHLCSIVENQQTLNAGTHTSITDNQSYTQQQDKSWKFEQASRFSLLDSIEEPQISSHFLNLEFLNVLNDLQL